LATDTDLVESRQSRILVNELLELLFRNTCKQNGFVVFDNACAGDPAVGIQTDERIDRFTGISGDGYDIIGQEGISQQATFAIDRGGGWIAFHRSEPVCLGKEFLDKGKLFFDLHCLRQRRNRETC